MAGRAPQRKVDEKSRHGLGRAPAGRFAVVAARFNESISKKLADGAASPLEAGGGGGRGGGGRGVGRGSASRSTGCPAPSSFRRRPWRSRGRVGMPASSASAW